jgi:FkbM family methyltransferase
MLKKKLKQLLDHIIIKGIVRPIASSTKHKFGSDYGGWNLETRLLDHCSMVYSFGIGDDASFDIEIINRFGLTVHAFDPTPRSLEWVTRQCLPAKFIFHPYGIAGHDGAARFYPPTNPQDVSFSIQHRSSSHTNAVELPVKRLSTIMSDLGHARFDVLKLDMEGAEYEVIADLAKSAIRPSQLLIEFHHHLPGTGIGKTFQAIRTIARMGYNAVSISDTAHEFSFRLIDTTAPRFKPAL